MSLGWIGVDLDGTLAEYHGWGDGSIGKPIPKMMNRVKEWLASGNTVKIFTARANSDAQRIMVHAWLEENGLAGLEVTSTKDFGMIELWDDRCIQVIPNTGMSIAEYVTTPPHERE
jgi:hypothetical protein